MSKTYAFFDLETSGFVDDKLPFEHTAQARVIQLACILTDESFKEHQSISLISSEDDFICNPGALAVHNINRAIQQQHGIPSKIILDTFQNILSKADVVVGYNIVKYDMKVMCIEASLNGRTIIYPSETVDVMDICTPICKLPSKYNNGKYKWPKLSEAYKHFFPDKEFTDAHDAMGDVRATKEIYSKILALAIF